MSASVSCTRMIELVTGVRTKRQQATRIAKTGMPATSPAPAHAPPPSVPPHERDRRSSEGTRSRARSGYRRRRSPCTRGSGRSAPSRAPSRPRSPASEQRLRRLSFNVMRCVPRRPLTLAEMRVVCREASETNTSSAGMPLARASERIGSRIGLVGQPRVLVEEGRDEDGRDQEGEREEQRRGQRRPRSTRSSARGAARRRATRSADPDRRRPRARAPSTGRPSTAETSVSRGRTGARERSPR